MKRVLVAALSLFLFACSGQDSPSPLTVNTGGNHYHNAFFGVSAEKPEGWYSQPPEETIALQQRGSAALLGDDKDREALIEASLKSSVPVFGFFRLPPGTPDQHNPNVLAVAENLAGFPGVKTGCDYLHYVRKLLQRGNMAYTFEEECATRTLGGEPFGYIEGRIAVGKAAVTQRYYSRVQNGYALSIIQTFFGQEGETQTGSVLQSLQFDTP